jgi:hypothetical protein
MFAASSAASGPDYIPPEALKANPDLTASILHKICSDMEKRSNASRLEHWSSN